VTAKTCAACDCELDGSLIKVKIGGKAVEVCCDECAQKLKEAHGSTAASRKGKRWTETK
jgi:ribosome-binding protein aMBF1 (putative translation factor)